MRGICIRASVGILAASLLAPAARAADALDGRVHLSGYVESRLGAWLHDEPTSPLRFPGITDDPPGNDLAVFRNTLDLELDARLVPRTELHAVFRAVYEPRYPVDDYASVGSHFGKNVLGRSAYNEPDFDSEPIRELWLRVDPAPDHSIRAGRQIVNWGESLAFRVADVINPNDGRFNLFFVDPEESRIPQWMVQGLHGFPFLPGSPSLEWIVLPPLESASRRVNDLAPTGSRFAIPPESRASDFPVMQSVPTRPALWTVQRAALNGRAAGTPAAVDFRFLDDAEKDFPDGTSVGARLLFAVGPLNLALFDWYGHELNPVVEDLGVGGFRVADYDGVLSRPDLGDAYRSLRVPRTFRLNEFRFRYPRQNVFGVTGNAYVAALKAVARFELALRPNRVYQVDGFDPVTGAITDRDGLTRRDELQWQLALDFAGIYWRWLNPTADFAFTLEYTQTVVDGPLEGLRAGVYETPVERVADTLSFRAATNYAYNCIQPSVTVIVQPSQDAWATVATLGLQAPWDENLSAELRWVAIGGESEFAGLGFFQSKDFVLAALRYSF